MLVNVQASILKNITVSISTRNFGLYVLRACLLRFDRVPAHRVIRHAPKELQESIDEVGDFLAELLQTISNRIGCLSHLKQVPLQKIVAKKAASSGKDVTKSNNA